MRSDKKKAPAYAATSQQLCMVFSQVKLDEDDASIKLSAALLVPSASAYTSSLLLTLWPLSVSSSHLEQVTPIPATSWSWEDTLAEQQLLQHWASIPAPTEAGRLGTLPPGLPSSPSFNQICCCSFTIRSWGPQPAAALRGEEGGFSM